MSGYVDAKTFNGPLEAGLRAVAILDAAFPEAIDLQRPTAYDYLLVNTELLGGPDDLHPRSIISAPITQVRRGTVQSALYLMMTRNLVERVIDAEGIRYRAGEAATFFLETLLEEYTADLKYRASWLVSHLTSLSDNEFEALMRRFFDSWVIEFQASEQSSGVES